MENENVKTTRISATSSLTVNLGNYNSGRVEMTIEKSINNPDLIDMKKVKEELWEEVNTEVDKQIQDLRNAMK